MSPTSGLLSVNSSAVLSGVQVSEAVAQTSALFQRLTVDDQLAALWYLYKECGRSITAAAPGAARLQFAEGLLNQIKSMSPAEQLQAQREIATSANTAVSRAYGVLSPNTKLAFWYRLAEWMEAGFVVPMPAGYQMSEDVAQAIAAIQALDFGQQITVLRNVVIDMGVDPLA